jgi:hypothetical protein
MSINARLLKLERVSPTNQIPVCCDADADVPAAINVMLAEREIAGADTERCVFWPLAESRVGAHEASLAELD